MKNSVLLLLLFGLAGFYEKAWGRPSTETELDDDLMVNDADDDSDDEPGKPAIILSKGQNFTVISGQSIRLPCEIENIEEAVVQWRRNFSEALFFDETKQLPEPRYTLSKNQTLTIENISSVDETSFSCQLLDETDQTITYWLTVKEVGEPTSQPEQRGHGMPKVIRVLPDHLKVLKKGEPYTIMCEVGGYPHPTISWSHKGKPLKESEGKNAIHIDAVTRKDAGKYVCTATNQNGQDSRTAEIQVLYPPEIEMPHEPIIAGEGYESEIICNVHSHPAAEVSWYKGAEQLTPTYHMNMLQEGHRHILRISATKTIDYGSYTCIAKNNFGESQKTVELTGKPGKPSFENSSYSEDSVSSPLLIWSVKSFKPIEEFEVLYKKQHVDDWVTVPLEESAFTGQHTSVLYVYSYTFKDLEPGTYEAKVRAKNVYGWSDYSDVHVFAGNDIGRAMQSKLLESSLNEGSGVSCLELSRISLVFLLSILFAHYLQ